MDLNEFTTNFFCTSDVSKRKMRLLSVALCSHLAREEGCENSLVWKTIQSATNLVDGNEIQSNLDEALRDCNKEGSNRTKSIFTKCHWIAPIQTTIDKMGYGPSGPEAYCLRTLLYMCLETSVDNNWICDLINHIFHLDVVPKR